MKLALLAAIPILLGCGGRETMASKSAAAFDEAKRKDVPVAVAQPPVEHEQHASMPPMDHSAMAGMDHSKMSHAQMDHSSMDHAQMDHAQMDHSKMNHAQMDHSSMSHATMPAPPPPIVIPPPTTNSAITRMQPAATLKPDEFDAPPHHEEGP